MRVEKTATGVIIKEPTMDVKREVLRYFSLNNPTREFFIYCGNDPDSASKFGGEKDVIYLTSGALNVRSLTLRSLNFGIKTLTPPTPANIDLGATREPRSQLQKDCIEKLTTSKSPKITVEVRPGTGKGHPVSTKLPSPDKKEGYIQMGKLKVGDHLFDANGNPTEVTNIYELGVVKVFKVTFQDGRYSYCTGEHLWNVIDRNGITMTVLLKDLINSDYRSYRIPNCKPVEYHKIQNTSLDQLSVETKQMMINMLCDDVNPRYEDSIKQMIYSMGMSCHYVDHKRVIDPIPQLYITDISYDHDEECRCITVNNEDSLYLTEDYIVTHNTFMALYSIAKLHLKPLIVCPTTNLKAQWIENIINEGIDENDIATNIYEAYHKKICVVTITSLENAIREDWNRLKSAVTDGSFGIKIVDEAHLHLKGIMKFDSICNIKHNWYLSATLGRSDDSEDRILNRLFLDAERFVGTNRYEEYQKEYIQIYLQDIYYNPTMSLCESTFKYGTKGLVKATYYRMLTEYKRGIPFYTNIITMMKRAKAIAPDGKLLVLVPLLEIIDRVKEMIQQDPELRKYSLGDVNGKMSPAQKSEMLEREIILSTTLSVGTGVDIMDLRAVVNFDQYQSPIINEQIVGRLRDRGEVCHYFDICDHVKYAKTIATWGRRRRQYFIAFPGIKKEMKLLRPIYC